MTKYIDLIYQDNYRSGKNLNIKLNGKSLIITGRNGSGKTSLIRSIYNKTEVLIRNRGMADLSGLRQDYDSLNRAFLRQEKGTSQYESYKNSIANIKEKIDRIDGGLHLNISGGTDFYERLAGKSAVLRLFEATRAAKIAHADTARGIKVEKEKKQKEDVKLNFGSNLEQHLVNLKNRKSLALTEDGDELLAGVIESWLESFRKNLAYLMEDDSTELEFDSSSLKFKIKQDNKDAYTFQDLSSGYSAILDVYADLLMRTEYFGVSPKELTGVVFIDEIDAHLHVSLQRLILPFFENSFPAVQFIVTTHSPFVLMSVNDAIIYDAGRNEQIESDLSFYSYSAVMEGILGVKPTSRLLDDVIKEIALISNAENKNIARLRELLERVDPVKDKLDDRSMAYYLGGKNALMDSEGEE